VQTDRTMVPKVQSGPTDTAVSEVRILPFPRFARIEYQLVRRPLKAESRVRFPVRAPIWTRSLAVQSRDPINL
jgi:hypothetical protein